MKVRFQCDLLCYCLVGCLNIIAQLLLNHGVDSHTCNQYDDNKKQIRTQQLDQEGSTHEMQHSQYSSASSVGPGQQTHSPTIMSRTRVSILHVLYHFDCTNSRLLLSMST